MATGKIASYEQELRMAVAEAMVNGRDYGEIREYLTKTGLAEAELPSDYSLRTYKESVEYRHVERKLESARDLKLQAGTVVGGLDAKVTLLQDACLQMMENMTQSGFAEPADIYKIFGLTLQYQKVRLAQQRTRQAMGRPELPEAPGLKQVSTAEFDAVVAEVMAKEHARLAAEAAADDDTDESTEAGVEATSRIIEESGGNVRIMGDAEAADSSIASIDAAVAALQAAGDVEVMSRISEDSGGSPRILEDACAVREPLAMSTATAAAPPAAKRQPVFANSPSAATRARARKRRKKSKR